MASHHWSAKPGLEQISRLRNAVADYTAGQGVSEAVVDDVALAVSEIVTNAVIHAYPDGRDGSIDVMATVNGDSVTVRVLDDGVGVRARMDSPGAGLGLAIAGRISQRFVIEHRPRGGTEVRMTFAKTA
jgi:anti-sigma regulatory factor (Ser/Thr protein kinase)